ncbi:MAG: hypothetical protein WC346_17030, partial [Methanogenium sp.]
MLDQKEKINTCECGCETEIKSNVRFVSGHNRRGKKLSDEHKKKISITKIGDKNPAKRLDVRAKKSLAQK